MVGVFGLAGCTRTVYVTRGVSAPTPQSQICSGLSELDAIFAATPSITAKTTPDELKKLRDDVERSSEKVTSQRGRYNETARVDLQGARQNFLMVVDHSGSATGVAGSASKQMNDTYQALKGSTNAVRYSLKSINCSTATGSG
jgi:hypothetical protein